MNLKTLNAKRRPNDRVSIAPNLIQIDISIDNHRKIVDYTIRDLHKTIAANRNQGPSVDSSFVFLDAQHATNFKRFKLPSLADIGNHFSDNGELSDFQMIPQDKLRSIKFDLKVVRPDDQALLGLAENIKCSRGTYESLIKQRDSAINGLYRLHWGDDCIPDVIINSETDPELRKILQPVIAETVTRSVLSKIARIGRQQNWSTEELLDNDFINMLLENRVVDQVKVLGLIEDGEDVEDMVEEMVEDFAKYHHLTEKINGIQKLLKK